MLARAAIPAALLLLAIPSVAFAHVHLRRTEPAAGAKLRSVPHEIRLVFTEPVQLAVSAITLTGPDGARVPLAILHVDPANRSAIVASITGALRAGTYTVAWRAVSPDGHPARGRFGFTIIEGAAGLAASAPPAGATVGRAAPAGPESEASAAVPSTPVPAAQTGDETGAVGALDVGSPLYVAVRWLGYVAVLALIGAVAFALVVLPRMARLASDVASSDALAARARAGAARVGAAGAWLLLIDGVIRLAAQSYAINGSAAAWSGAAVGAIVGGTVWGWGWMLEIAAALLAIGAMRSAHRGRGGWMLAAVAAAAVALALALSGHAVDAPRLAPLLVLADALHVLSAGGWLGTLLVVAVIGIPAALAEPAPRRGRAAAELIGGFSPVALACVAVLVLTGVIAAWVHLGTLAALAGSSYGRVLLLKLAAVAVVLALGALNWRVMRPRLGDVSAAHRLRRSASAELVTGVVVLAITAVLVATSPPTSEQAARRVGAGPVAAKARE